MICSGPADATATFLASLKSTMVLPFFPAYTGCCGKEAVKWMSISVVANTTTIRTRNVG